MEPPIQTLNRRSVVAAGEIIFTFMTEGCRDGSMHTGSMHKAQMYNTLGHAHVKARCRSQSVAIQPIHYRPPLPHRPNSCSLARRGGENVGTHADRLAQIALEAFLELREERVASCVYRSQV